MNTSAPVLPCLFGYRKRVEARRSHCAGLGLGLGVCMRERLSDCVKLWLYDTLKKLMYDAEFRFDAYLCCFPGKCSLSLSICKKWMSEGEGGKDRSQEKL